MNNRSILARLARLIICSVHIHLRRRHFSFLFDVSPMGPESGFACRAADCMFRRGEGKKHFFSALLMINVLIFLDMVWFGFWYSPTTTTTMHLGHFEDACAILKCVLLFRGYHFICNKLARVGWIVVEQQIFIFFLSVFPSCFESKAHTFVVKRCRRRNNINVRCIMSSKQDLLNMKRCQLLCWNGS